MKNRTAEGDAEGGYFSGKFYSDNDIKHFTSVHFITLSRSHFLQSAALIEDTHTCTSNDCLYHFSKLSLCLLSEAVMGTLDSVSFDHTCSFLYAIVIFSPTYLIMIAFSPLPTGCLTTTMYTECNYTATPLSATQLYLGLIQTGS